MLLQHNCCLLSHLVLHHCLLRCIVLVEILCARLRVGASGPCGSVSSDGGAWADPAISDERAIVVRDKGGLFTARHDRLVRKDRLAIQLVFARKQPHVCLRCQTELLAPGPWHDADVLWRRCQLKFLEGTLAPLGLTLLP